MGLIYSTVSIVIQKLVDIVLRALLPDQLYRSLLIAFIALSTSYDATAGYLSPPLFKWRTSGDALTAVGFGDTADEANAATIAWANANMSDSTRIVTVVSTGPCVHKGVIAPTSDVPYGDSSDNDNMSIMMADCPVRRRNQYLSPPAFEPFVEEFDQLWGMIYMCPHNAGSTSDFKCACFDGRQLYFGQYDAGYLMPSGEIVKIGACRKTREWDNTRKKRPKQCYGNPIYPLNGAKREHLDTRVGVNGISLSLTYDSSPLVPVSTTASQRMPAEKVPGFGSLWSSSMHRRLTFSYRGGESMIYIYAHRGDGTAVPFTKVVTSASLYTSDGDVADVLSGTPIGGYVYVDKQNGSIEQYTGDGLITSITTARGERMTFTYSVNTTPVSIAPGAGHLLRVEDSKGRAVEFEYALSSLFAPSRITRVKDSSGRYLQFSYSTAGELASITWQDGRTREFKYELASLPSALTGVVDERGVRSASFGYSASGVALSTENAGGLNRFAVSYLQEPVIEVESESYDLSTKTVSRTLRRIAPQGVQITTPNNMPVDLLSTIVGGTPFVLGKSQPAGSGCAASTSSSTYDANGNATSTDDFNGTRSCSVYSGTLETVRVDGLSNNTACSTVTGAGTTLPANSRKTAMAWHPQWRLQTKLAEPRKLTTTVYNGQPDPFNGNAVASCAPAAAPLPDGTPIAVICKTVEQATTDLDGKFGLSATIDASVPNRINTFTYNQFGSVLTATDARNFTTTYAYYPTSTATAKIGDLQSITNAVGKVQTFDAYDATGALLSSTDPRGAVTTYSYDNRQRLLSTSVAGLITSYAYDNAGRLATVTMPDTSSIQYGYDDANRMTGITDSAGNTVTYVLDTSGNATSEQWKDSTGALAKNITRVFDALNRLQSATGARQ